MLNGLSTTFSTTCWKYCGKPNSVSFHRVTAIHANGFTQFQPNLVPQFTHPLFWISTTAGISPQKYPQTFLFHSTRFPLFKMKQARSTFSHFLKMSNVEKIASNFGQVFTFPRFPHALLLLLIFYFFLFWHFCTCGADQAKKLWKPFCQKKFHCGITNTTAVSTDNGWERIFIIWN